MTELNRRQLLLSGFVMSASSFAEDSLLAQTTALPAEKAKPIVNMTPPPFESPELTMDQRLVFRIWAPRAKSVKLRDGDLYLHRGQKYPPEFSKDGQGLWTSISGPLPAGAYRYLMEVDGVPTVDPCNTKTSESNSMTWSLAVVHGLDRLVSGDVPHGALSSVFYYSSTLRRRRRMHIYTPPGYGTSCANFPILYLLHGSGDSDDTWSSVGQANYILDVLIAAKRAFPMMIVMPLGHISRREDSMPTSDEQNEFIAEFGNDIMPYIRRNYRVNPAQTAIAGVSMGGEQAIDLLMSYPDHFGYVGIWSAGIFERPHPSSSKAGSPATVSPDWINRNASVLKDKDLKRGLKLLSFDIGSDDGLLGVAKATVHMFEEQGFSPLFTESNGGHSWSNWRDYLNKFAPRIFR